MNWIQANWLSWSVQILILSAVGCFLPRAIRLTDPKSRLLGAQFTLLACLILPFGAQRLDWRSSARVAVTGGSLQPAPGRRVPRKRPSVWMYAVPAVLGAGALFRLAGLGAGLWKLRRYRRAGRPLDIWPEAVHEAFALTGTSCAIRISEESHSPATFGLLQPFVMLPKRFRELPRETQLAIVCHELLHVRRKDWVAALVEEFVSGLLWFQPAVYVLIADIRLAREQVVDQETKRLFANASFAALLCTAGWISSVTFPLVAVAQEKQDKAAPAQSYDFQKAFPPATGPRLRVGGNVSAANLLTQVKPPYPADARNARIQGKVSLGTLIGTDGHVLDVVLISVPDALVQSAVDAVRQWVYRPTLLNGEPVEVVTVVDVNYTLSQ